MTETPAQAEKDDHLDDFDFDEDERCEHGTYPDECRWCEAEYECGLMPDGQCLNAGSEHCDWRCPYRDSEDFAGSAAWNRKRGKKTP